MGGIALEVPVAHTIASKPAFACCPSKFECQVPVGFFCLLAHLSNKIGAVVIEVELDPGGAGGEEFSSKFIFGIDELYVVATTRGD